MKNLATIFGLMKLGYIYMRLYLWYVTVESVHVENASKLRCMMATIKMRMKSFETYECEASESIISIDKSIIWQELEAVTAEWVERRRKQKKTRDIIKRGKIIHLRLTWPNSNVVTVFHATYKVNGISELMLITLVQRKFYDVHAYGRMLMRSRKFLFRGILWFWAEKWGHMNKIASTQPLKYWMRNYSHWTDRTIQSKSCYSVVVIIIRSSCFWFAFRMCVCVCVI